ncbi:MAG TPA: hypothetical protein PKY38_11260, partial [Opitutaceae bacterium]|nr:hypothetical protein [Opitutaceae bacterium]
MSPVITAPKTSASTASAAPTGNPWPRATTSITDPTLGKEMGKLVSVLGGRLGALREAGGDVSEIAM